MDTVATVANEISVISLFSQASVFVKFIMLGLLTMSVVVWAVLIEKYNRLRVLKRRADKFEEAFWGEKGLEDLYRNTQPEDTDHPMAMLFVVGLREWERAKDSEGEEHGIIQLGVVERVHRLMNATMVRELERIEKYLPMLATVGATAPFVGLLGTVWGIMHSFQTIGVTKNTSLASVAPGIAEALLATAVGLFAAIPAVLAYNKLSTDLGRYASRLENFVTEFVTILDRQQQEAIVSARKSGKKRRASDNEQKLAS
ncbi:MAG: protein TolQ [Proteobacteria bacterium]|nr:protein TolQ [Pseudomonadota bacterium]